VRQGLVALLVTSGLWAGSDLGLLLATTRPLKEAAHIVGLIAGFATIWAWLYFCSAYTRRTLHRNRWVQYMALAVYVAVVAIKVTNPLHQLYFTLGPLEEPFPHLGIRLGLLYWIINGLSYLLAVIGYAMLVPLLRKAGSARWPLTGLIGLTALPLGLNAASVTSSALLGLNHDALGVAAFAVGVLFAYTGYFQDVQRFGEQDQPALTIGPGGRIRNFNEPARQLFPALRDGRVVGQPLREVLPAAAEALQSSPNIFRMKAPEASGPTTNGPPPAANASAANASPATAETPVRYMRVTSSQFGAGLDQPGQLLVFSDVTAQERKRRVQESQLQSLIDTIPGVVFRLRARPDGSYDVPFLSETARELLGLSPSADKVFDQFIERVAPSHREAFMASVEDAVEQQAAWRFEVPYDRPDGTRRWFLAASTPERRGETVLFNGMLLDITPQKEAQQALRETKERAEQARKEAESARQEAERASRLKSAFLANMSHEIRTPLTSIIGFAGVIGEEAESSRAPTPRFARLIEQNGRALLDTINTVLNFSKLEAGEMNLTVEPVNVASVVDEEMRRLRRRAEEKEIDLQVESDTVRVNTSRAGIEIVLRNLVSNAIKYTEAGGQVQVRVRQGDGEVRLEVEDTGIGMAPDAVDGLFEAFRQESEGKNREFEGTGLGLSVVRKIVDQMDGTIDVATEKGEGTCFTVRVPHGAA
jgi:PAS domain S-box-containing protein